LARFNSKVACNCFSARLSGPWLADLPPFPAHDWISLLGDIGSFALSQTSLSPEPLKAMKRLNSWVQRITSRTLSLSVLATLEAEIPQILTQLELCFPSYVFTVSVHQLLHLPEMIRQLGPLQSFWGYSIERFCAFVAKLKKSPKGPEVRLWSGLCLPYFLTDVSYPRIISRLVLRTPI
jgi:hypothetical protein